MRCRLECVSPMLRWLCASVFALAAGPAGAQQASTAQAPASGVTAPSAESQARARAILSGMARHLAGTQHFSVRILGAYDVVQGSGEKVEFAETRRVAVSRPDRLRLALERSDGSRLDTVFTGTQIVLFDPGNNVYATSRQHGSLDRAVIHYVSGLGMSLPLAVLLLTTLPAELDARVRSIDYVERTTAHGAPAHHLAGRTGSVDFQMWVADAEPPVLQRIVVTYRAEPGQPQYRALFSNWNFAPSDEGTFAVSAPAGARLIPFAATLGRLVPGSHPLEEEIGSR